MLIDRVQNIPNINQTALQTQKINPSFGDILTQEICNQSSIKYPGISNDFYDMDITFRVGNCDISRKDWENDSFPFWKYFDNNTEVNDICNWNRNCKVSEAEKQKNLQKIGFGEMVIVIPENLKVKMLEDSSFSELIYNKIVKWKENYDEMDNAIAASNGLNTSIYQFSKSYCITLDENGEIDNYVVVSGGLDDSTSGTSQAVEKFEVISKKINRYTIMGDKENKIESNPLFDVYKDKEDDYLEIMSIFASSFQKRIK